jgi:hypothetical protein
VSNIEVASSGQSKSTCWSAQELKRQGLLQTLV